MIQNPGFETKPFWHYAVVVGYDAEPNEMILRSGTESQKRLALDKFIETWQRAESWGFVLLDSKELPVKPDFERYCESVVDMEQVLHADQMIKFYEHAHQRFPQQTIVAFGLADAYGRSGRLADAASLYKRILTTDPQHVAATNNLAVTLQELSCNSEALQMAQTAVVLSQASGQFVSESQDTLQSIIDQQKDQQASEQCQFDTQITSFYAEE